MRARCLPHASEDSSLGRHQTAQTRPKPRNTSFKSALNRRLLESFFWFYVPLIVIVLSPVAFAGPRVWRMTPFGGSGRSVVAETQCKQLWDDIILFESIQKVKVTDIRDLEQPVDGADEPWRTVNQDPWGNDYWLETDGGKRYVYSSGPDGQEGTEDDISWPRLDK